VFGASAVFPRRFAAAAADLLARPGGAAVPPQHAFWYFGSALRLWIQPHALKWRLADYVHDGRRTRWIGSSFLDGADWSGALSPLRGSPVHREMVQLVKADFRFRDTRVYHRLCRAAEAGRPRLRSGVLLTTRDHVDAYFRYCVALAESVRRHGVMPHREAKRGDAPIFGHRAGRLKLLERAERDIGVAICADGALVRHLGGKHRMALACAFKLEHVPVEVRMVHVRWLERQMERTGLPPHAALMAALGALRENGAARA
jgi:hypothetical protein